MTVMTDTIAGPVRELDAFELDAVSGGALLGLLSIGFAAESQSIFESQTLWKGGLIAERLDSYQSISAGSFSFGLNV